MDRDTRTPVCRAVCQDLALDNRVVELALTENSPQTCATGKPHANSGTHRMTEKQLRARTSLLKAMLLVSALLMGYSDLITTNEILQRGMGELNPFMRFTQEWLGEWWLIAKLGLRK